MFTRRCLSQIIRSYGNAMQGMMARTWRRTCRRSSTSRQAAGAEQGLLRQQQGRAGDVDAVRQTCRADAAVDDVELHRAVEDLFMQMQENMSKQARSMFTGFQFPTEKEVRPGGDGAASRPAGRA